MLREVVLSLFVALVKWRVGRLVGNIGLASRRRVANLAATFICPILVTRLDGRFSDNLDRVTSTTFFCLFCFFFFFFFFHPSIFVSLPSLAAQIRDCIHPYLRLQSLSPLILPSF